MLGSYRYTGMSCAKVLPQPSGKNVVMNEFLFAYERGTPPHYRDLIAQSPSPLSLPRSHSKENSILRRLLLDDCKGSWCGGKSIHTPRPKAGRETDE